MKIIDGKLISNQIKQEILKDVANLKTKGIIPTLTIIQVGDNPSSNVYVRNKKKLSEDLQTNTTICKLDANITQEELAKVVHQLNEDKNINGILVQLPLPKHINEEFIINQIDSSKDVDGFTLNSVGTIWTAKKHAIKIASCTPAGVIEMLKRSNIEIEGKHAVIIGRSNIVGKPLACLLLLENATVTICHSRTKNLKEITKQADILCAAIGQPKFVTRDFIKKDTVVIDVGINHDENNKLCGDVDFEDVKDLVSYITPVPGGVGPMTVIMLMKNLIALTKKQNNIE